MLWLRCYLDKLWHNYRLGFKVRDFSLSKKLLRSGLIVSVMTFVSRILGLVRDVMLANVLGASAVADVYYLVAKIPNFLRRLFAEGAFAQAFVPVLSEYQTQKSEDEVRRLIAYVSGTLGTIVTVVAILGVIGSPVLAAIFANGWFLEWLNDGTDAHKYELASFMLKITFPYIWFITLVGLSGSILNAMGRFAVSSFTPVFLNLSIISAVVFFSPHFDEPAVGIAWGWFLGGLVQLLFQIPFLYKAKMLVRPKWGWNDEGVIKIRTLMIPALFGVSVGQINLLLDTVIASYLSGGSVSWLFYSDRLLEFPLGLFGIAIATVILPLLSRQHSGDNTHFKATMDWGVRMVMLMGIPAMIGLIVLAQPMINVLFYGGAFKEHDVTMAGYSLTAYACGLLSFMLIKVLAPGFYARQDTKTPVRIGIKAMIANMVFNLILVLSLGYEYGYIGLAGATALSATCNAFWLHQRLKQDGIFAISSQTMIFGVKAFISALAMAALVIYLMPLQAYWINEGTWLKGLELAKLIVVAAISYFAVFAVLGLRPKHLKSEATD